MTPLADLNEIHDINSHVTRDEISLTDVTVTNVHTCKMSGNNRSKRKSKRTTKYTRSKKSRKIVDVVENDIETFENGCDVVSSILEENGKSDNKIDDEMVSISSDTLLCLEEVLYCDSSSIQQSMSPITNWGSDVSSLSLVIGEGYEAEILRDKIKQLTSCHGVHICSQEQSFELCNTKGFVLVWLIATVPVGPEILSITTSIRYASKYNKGTVTIGVANAISTVDLRLLGIDEVVIQPVDGDAIRQKYSKWTSVTIVPGDLDCSENEVLKVIQCKTERPNKPLEVCPPPTPSADTSDRSCSELSIPVDSSGMSQLSLSQLPEVNIYKCIATSVGQQNGRQKYKNGHKAREKVRRDRIKDSCDQLKVLLPCIRGRKTDTASILEMCVDYLKLVSATLPPDFQNQIIEILAKDSLIPDSTLPNEKRSKFRKSETDTNTVSSTVDTDINNNETGNTNFGGLSNNLPLQDQQQTSYNFSGGHHPLFNEFDIQNLGRPFSAHDPYANANYGSPLESNKNMHDRENFGSYLDKQSFYQFYGSNTMCSYGIAPVPDYVNPDAVLPIS